MKTDFKYLLRTAEGLGCTSLASKVLNDDNFKTCSGSHHESAHHYGDHGLLRHTYEVVRLCLDISKMYEDIHNIRTDELYLSALYHDYGKIWDYVKTSDGKWTACDHRRKIHHISRSNVEWVRHATFMNADTNLIDRVSHNILSHHGSRECGSPIAPHSREAWILHLSDTISARVDDCDRIDIVKINKNG